MVTERVTIRRGRLTVAAVTVALSLVSQISSADVVAVVSSKSSITNLSKTQLTDIFLGKVSRFPNGTHVVPIDQAEGSAARAEFYAKITDKSEAQMKAYWSKIIFTGRGQPPKTVASGADMKQEIAENLQAIGYIEEKLVDDSVRVLR